jgi:hypothetical protein
MSRHSESATAKLTSELARQLVQEEQERKGGGGGSGAGGGDSLSFPRAPVSIVYPVNMNPRKLFWYNDVFTSSSVSEAESFYRSLRGSSLPPGLTDLMANKPPQQKEYGRMVLFYLVNLNRYIRIYRGFLAPDYPTTGGVHSIQEREFDGAIRTVFVTSGVMVASIRKFADLAARNIKLDESTLIEIIKVDIVSHLNNILTGLLGWTPQVRNVGGYTQLVPTMFILSDHS